MELYLFNIYLRPPSQKAQYRDLSWRDLSEVIVRGAPLKYTKQLISL